MLQPVRDLSSEIARLGMLAVGFALSIILGMWWMTIRSWNRSRSRLTKALLPRTYRTTSLEANTSEKTLKFNDPPPDRNGE